MIGNQQVISVIMIRIIRFISLFSVLTFFLEHLTTFDDFIFLKIKIYPIDINMIKTKLKLSKDKENREAITDLE